MFDQVSNLFSWRSKHLFSLWCLWLFDRLKLEEWFVNYSELRLGKIIEECSSFVVCVDSLLFWFFAYKLEECYTWSIEIKPCGCTRVKAGRLCLFNIYEWLKLKKRLLILRTRHWMVSWMKWEYLDTMTYTQTRFVWLPSQVCRYCLLNYASFVVGSWLVGLWQLRLQ